MPKLRLMQQNQWNAAKNYWEALGLDSSAGTRMRGHMRVFRELDPDIVGGQEITPLMQKYLYMYAAEENIPYNMLWGYYAPIVYRRDKFDVLDSEFLAYPMTMPEYPAFEDDSLSKACNVGVFRAKEDGKIFIFATTHLWWTDGTNKQSIYYFEGSDEIRLYQMKMALELIAKYQKKYNGCPVIFGGDLNTGYNSTAVQYAMTEGGYQHAHDIATDFRHEGRGYNDCSGSAPGVWQDLPFETAIDHILVKDIPEGAVKRFDRYCPDYYLVLSDHAPVYIDIEL